MLFYYRPEGLTGRKGTRTVRCIRPCLALLEEEYQLSDIGIWEMTENFILVWVRTNAAIVGALPHMLDGSVLKTSFRSFPSFSLFFRQTSTVNYFTPTDIRVGRCKERERARARERERERERERGTAGTLRNKGYASQDSNGIFNLGTKSQG